MPVGAKGLMYTVPETFADSFDMPGIDYGPADAFQPEVNIGVGAWQLGRLLVYYGGDGELALMACNAGAGNVDECMEKRTDGSRDR